MNGISTTKESKKKHSSRLVGGAETTHSKAVAGRLGDGAAGRAGTPTFMWINWEEQLGSKTDHETQGSSMGKEALKHLTKKL